MVNTLVTSGEEELVSLSVEGMVVVGGVGRGLGIMTLNITSLNSVISAGILEGGQRGGFMDISLNVLVVDSVAPGRPHASPT